MNYENAIYIFIILMLVVYIVDYYLINKRKLNNKKKKKKLSELEYLVSKFKLDKNKLNLNRVIIGISLINSFIISIVSVIIMCMPFKLMWQMIIAFGLLFGLIYALYEIYGRYLKKMEVKKK